jgi:hypothetical protein
MIFLLTSNIASANGDESWRVLAEAVPDECFYSMEDPDANDYPIIPAEYDECLA